VQEYSRETTLTNLLKETFLGEEAGEDGSGAWTPEASVSR
jgi:hypothetical protein